MLPALCYYLYKKYRSRFRSPKINWARLRSGGLLIGFILAGTIPVVGQTQTRHYQVKRNGQVIGELSFQQQDSGGLKELKMQSHVKTRLLFGIEVRTEDFSTFKEGLLTYSYVRRNINGKQKEWRETKRANGKYVFSHSNSKVKSGSITYNMMRLYDQEPLAEKVVFSDHHQQLLEIKIISPHTYKIQLPGGGYNVYYYEKGVCQRVEVHHALYELHFELLPSTLLTLSK